MSDDRGRPGAPDPSGPSAWDAGWSEPLEHPPARPIVKIAAITVVVGLVLLSPVIYLLAELFR